AQRAGTWWTPALIPRRCCHGSDWKKHQEDGAEGATGIGDGSAAAAAAGLDGIWMCVCGCQGNGLANWLWQMGVGVPARSFLFQTVPWVRGSRPPESIDTRQDHTKTEGFLKEVLH